MVTRRRVLAAAGAGTAAGLAGCVSTLGGERSLDPEAAAQFRVDLRRRGYRPDVTVPGSVEVGWELPGVNTGDHTAAKASVVEAPDGSLLVPGDSGFLWSVRPDGEVRWRADVTDATRGIHGTPAVANGQAYIGAYDGALSAFDLGTGERDWRSDLGDAIGSSPGYHDGTVYIAVEYAQPSGSVFAVDAATGAPERVDGRPTDHPHSTAAIDREAGRLVVGSNDGRLYAWTYPGFEFEWSYPTGRPIKGPVATDGEAAYVGSWDNRVYRLDLATGERDWAFAADDMVMSGPSLADGVVYVGSHDDRLYALDAATGTERWRFETDGWLIGCPLVTAEHVLVGSYDRHLYCLTRSGEEAWRVGVEGWVTSTPLVTDDGVYFTERAPDGSDGVPGKAYALRPA